MKAQLNPSHSLFYNRFNVKKQTTIHTLPECILQAITRDYKLAYNLSTCPMNVSITLNS